MKIKGLLAAALMLMAGRSYSADFADLQSLRPGNVPPLAESIPVPARGFSGSSDKKLSDYCKDSFKKLEANAAAINALEISAEEKALLLKMNDNARKSVELTCGVTKPEPYDYCKDSFRKLAATAAEIQALDVSPETRALLLKMNDNARKSVELACGVTKPEPYDYCTDSFKKLAATAAEIQAMDVDPETKTLLLKMNDNARRSVELVCGSR